MLKGKITSKGQITIPRAIREKMGLEKGGHVIFDEQDGIIILRKAAGAGSFEKWTGYLKEAEGQSPDELIMELRGS